MAKNAPFEDIEEKFTEFEFENMGNQVRPVIEHLAKEQLPLDFQPCRIHGHHNEKINIIEKVCKGHTILALLV
jgi:hypothetical protein